jgi:NAD(P)-dependent dehydrogenase (short-subunit alcohol dehydrogenase family)
MKKNILVTGSSRGLGKFISEDFSKEGHNIFGFSRSKKKGLNFLQYRCDLLNIRNIKKNLSILKNKYKKLDGLILCAGDSKKYYKKTENYSDWIKSFNSNFYSATNIIESYLNVFKNKPTKIVIISSIAGVSILKTSITYAVAKASLNFYAKFKAKELAKYNISLNVISPGNILMTGNNWDKKIIKNRKSVLRYIKKVVPNNKFCNGRELVELCKFLIFKNNNAIGSNFVIDGGQSI